MATTPVNNVRIVISVHATPAVTAAGSRRETGKAPEGDAVTALGADRSEMQVVMAKRIRQQARETSTSVAIVHFAPATTEGKC